MQPGHSFVRVDCGSVQHLQISGNFEGVLRHCLKVKLVKMLALKRQMSCEMPCEKSHTKLSFSWFTKTQSFLG